MILLSPDPLMYSKWHLSNVSLQHYLFSIISTSKNNRLRHKIFIDGLKHNRLRHKRIINMLKHGRGVAPGLHLLVVLIPRKFVCVSFAFTMYIWDSFQPIYNFINSNLICFMRPYMYINPYHLIVQMDGRGIVRHQWSSTC